MLTYVATTLDQLVGATERGFREIRETLATQYVPRNEIDRRFDDVNLDVAALEARIKAAEDRAVQEAHDRQARLEQAARDREVAERQADRDQVEATRAARSDRWQRIALAVSSLLALIGTGTSLLHLH